MADIKPRSFMLVTYILVANFCGVWVQITVIPREQQQHFNGGSTTTYGERERAHGESHDYDIITHPIYLNPKL